MQKVLFFIAAVLLIGIGVFLFMRKTPVPPEVTDGTSASPTESPGMEPNYTDPSFGYSLYIPEGFVPEKQSDYSTLFYPSEQPQGPGPANFIYVSVVSPEMRETEGEVYNYSPRHYDKMKEISNTGASVNLAEGDAPDLSEWYTYTLASVEDINGLQFKNYENTKPWEFPAGTTENRFIHDTGTYIYIVGYYTGGDSASAVIDPRTALSSVRSFRLNTN